MIHPEKYMASDGWVIFDQHFCIVCGSPLPVGRHVARNGRRCCSYECKQINVKNNAQKFLEKNPDYHTRRWIKVVHHKTCVICSSEFETNMAHQLCCSKRCVRVRQTERDKFSLARSEWRQVKKAATRKAWSQRNPEKIAAQYERSEQKRKSLPRLKWCCECGTQLPLFKRKFCSDGCYKISSQREARLRPLRPRPTLYCRNCSDAIPNKPRARLCQECREQKCKENNQRSREKRRALLRAAKELGLISSSKDRTGVNFTALAQLGLT